MPYFLEKIASHLYQTYGNNLNRECLVFPNRRAGLYFLKYLSKLTGKPVWSPAIKTINELFNLYSSLQLAENEVLIFELYKTYRKLAPEAESFDDFYFWGEMLLNDFDDIDKYLVNASKLYRNLSDLKNIDHEFGELTDEQIDIIRQFWINFRSGSETKQKDDFKGIWALLPQLYNQFRESLIGKDIAYEGMIFRDLAERFRNNQIPESRWDHFHFIGFNALNQCEKVLMHSLKEAGKAKFFWDFDSSYVYDNSNHSAGFFIRQNLKEFGNDMPSDWDYSRISHGSNIEVIRNVIDTSSDVAQVKLVPVLLEEMNIKEGGDLHHTAIVLADENLMIPLISSLPEFISDVNITMGYPLKFSPVYSLVKHLLSLQKNSRVENGQVLFDHVDILNILKHSYFSDNEVLQGLVLTSEIISENKSWISSERFNEIQPYNLIFDVPTSPVQYPAYLRKILEIVYLTDDEKQDSYPESEINIRNEFIYKTILAINRLENIISESELNFTVDTCSRLIDKILRGITIPFSGEPLKGIQIMGILETRCLDFNNIILLSANEGILPRSSAGSSYIPFNLREAFGLPTIRHQDSIFAFYFYRLLQSAGNITFVYNSNSEGLKTGEMSRFLLQMKYLEHSPPSFSGSGYEIKPQNIIQTTLERSGLHVGILEDKFLGTGSKPISPSAINTWLHCRMKFYYRYVCALKEPEVIKTEIDPALFGEMLHKIMEKIYSPFRMKPLERDFINSLRSDSSGINNIIRNIINTIYRTGQSYGINEGDITIADILSSYVNQILLFDSSIAPITLKDLEKRIETNLEIKYNGSITGLEAGGVIDRLDQTGGIFRVVDYKTGSTTMELKSIESLFDENYEQRNEAWFQILMYCEIFSRENKDKTIRPALYAIRNFTDPEFTDHLILKPDRSTRLAINNYEEIRQQYLSGLLDVLENIFSKDTPFIMTEHRKKCEYCPFRQLCQR